MAGAGTQHGQTCLTPTRNANDVRLDVILLEQLKQASRRPLFGSECCIYRVHQWLREISEDAAYTPKVVSIGPFHRDKNVELTLKTKIDYVNDLLTRVTTTDKEYSTLVTECLASISMIEIEARNCYSETIDLNSHEFVNMMVVDGLFIIGLLWMKAGVVKTNGQDPLVDDERKLWTLVCDLVKLENQLPMIVLNSLLIQLPQLQVGLQDSHNITMLVLDFFDPLMPRDTGVRNNCTVTEPKHLLDLLGQTFVGFCTPVPTVNNSYRYIPIPKVTELEKIGMKFKKGSVNNTFVHIEFTGGGMLGFGKSVLEFSPVTIQDQTYFLLGNLIAFEEHCGDGRHVNHITSYALLMYRLLISGQDVRLLMNHGIITNYLGTEEDVSHFYKKLSREVTRSKFRYSALCDQVNLYCNSRWRVWRRKSTWQNIFTHWINPANIIGLLSVVFTIYAVSIALESLRNDKSQSKGSKK